MAVEELRQLPEVGPLFRRAVTGVVPSLVPGLVPRLVPGLGRRLVPGRRGGETLDDTELLVRGVAVDAERLAAYARVCGFRLSDALAPTYPHIMAFPLALELMTRPGFPFPLVGLVHVANTIEVLQPLDASQRLDLSVRAEGLRPHARGRVVDLVAAATVDGETVWRSRSEYLRREKAAPRPAASGPTIGERASREVAALQAAEPARAEGAPRSRAVWRVRPEVARAYAAASGDRNPIHTSTVAARLLGFPRRIAHGMWSKARCLAALEGRLPDAFTVDVSFKLPILLPSSVAFSATEESDGWRIALDDARTGKPHLVGSIRL